MFVKIVKSYRDTNMNLVLVPKDVILEVTDERAKELIEVGVAKDFTFAIPEIESVIVDTKPLEIKLDEEIVDKQNKVDKTEEKGTKDTKTDKKNK